MIGDELVLARAAAEAGDWERARDLLMAVPAGELGPEDTERLSWAQFFTDDLAAASATLQRAFVGFTRAGNRRRADVVAVYLTLTHLSRGAGAVGAGLIAYRDSLNPAEIARQIADLQAVLLKCAKEKTEQLYLSTIPSALPDVPQGHPDQGLLTHRFAGIPS